jgi:hypothetical protein
MKPCRRCIPVCAVPFGRDQLELARRVRMPRRNAEQRYASRPVDQLLLIGTRATLRGYCSSIEAALLSNR